MAQRWLFKTEPSDYSWSDLVADKRTEWDGVKNALALIHLRKVRKGDEILLYHTGKEKSVIGIAKAVSDPKGEFFDIAPVKPLPNPVPLATIKAEKSMKDFDLVRLPRLSVMPVSGAQWKEIFRLAK
jgi:predicted RNA-binding protein with PUA-like domain